MVRRVALTLIAGAALTFVVFGSPTAAEPPVFQPGPCPVSFATNSPVECGTVTVPQDRENPDERSLDLAVVVFRSQIQQTTPDPIIFLDGGPGSRTIDSYARGLGSFLSLINLRRDVVIFDYRGIGYSEPALTCPEVAGSTDNTWLAECRDRLTGEGLDFTNFTTRDNAQDAADIMHALGYETYNIWGGSYGSSVAMTLLRDRPEGIRAALVTALQPPQGELQPHTPVGIMRSLKSVSDLCAADASCAPLLDGDLVQMATAVIERLNESPVDAPAEVGGGTLDGVDALFVLGELLKDELNISTVPGLVATLYAGEYDVALPYANITAPSPDPLNPIGAWMSMRCTDSILAATPEGIANALAELPSSLHDMILTINEQQIEMCQTWGARIPTDADRAPAETDTPVLIMSGALDPYSSQEWLDSTLATLPNGHGFMVPYHMHYVVHNACASGILYDFLKDPARELDTGCIDDIPAPRFGG